ncbi:hypothetical protein [Caldalkalibacillus salinus]|uniref:hypothetical protein n=1 Tax=Caldalkalibacillus salinus TaxID=2803787 RepID=UPI001921E20B|nr:hypothetical protein [Caldalkalibacillus salinus]
MRNKYQIPFLILMGLALYGFILQLTTQPLRLVYDLLFFVAIAGIVWVIYIVWFRSKKPKIRYSKTQQRYSPKSQSKMIPFRSKGPRAQGKSKRYKKHTFTVIEGNKGKKKKPFSS